MKMKIVLCLIIALIFLVSCNSQQNIQQWNQTLQFVKWNSSFNYYINEYPSVEDEEEKMFIDLAFFVNNDKIIEKGNIQRISIVDQNGKEFLASAWVLHEGSTFSTHTAKTLVLHIDKVQFNNTTFIEKIRMKIDDEIVEKDLGNISIQILKGDKPDLLIVGKKTSFSSGGLLDIYKVELQNNTSQQVRIDDLKFEIPNQKYKIKIEVFKDFHDMSEIINNFTLEPGEKSTYLFNFSQIGESSSGFYAIRPLLKYVDEMNTVYYQTLDTAIYPPLIEEDTLIKYIE